MTFNPKEIGKGLKGIKDGVKEEVKGFGEGVAGIVEATPLGVAVNQLTNGGMNKFADGVTGFATSMVNDTLDAPGHIVHGVIHGDWKEAGMGALSLGSAALMVVPGAGEVVMGAKVAGEAALKAGGEFAAKASTRFAGEEAAAGAKAAGGEAGAKAGAKAAGGEAGAKAGAKAAGGEAAAANLADYEVLNGYAAKYGLTPLEANANPADVKALYKKLSLKMHPDKGGNPADFQKISNANQNIAERVPSTYEGPGMTAQEQREAAEAAAASARYAY